MKKLSQARSIVFMVFHTAALVLLLFTAAPAATTTPVSLAPDGSYGNDYSSWPAISDDGRYVVFISKASNLVADDTNGAPDFFVRDLVTGQTSRVSVASDGSQSNEPYDASRLWNSISADGRYVAFSSEATNLVPGDTNGQPDIFVHDRQTGATVRVSVASDGTQADRLSLDPKISGDGRYVAFMSYACTLVATPIAGCPGGNFYVGHIFVHDMFTGTTILASTASDGTPLYSDCQYPSISLNGRYVAFKSDTNILVHDLQTGETSPVSVASDGTPGNSWSDYPSISGDGNLVAFISAASNFAQGPSGISDIFVHNRTTGETILVSKAGDGTPANNDSFFPSISSNGRYIAFDSFAKNLVNRSTGFLGDIYLHDLQTGETTLLSQAPGGSAGNGWSMLPSSPTAISGDGSRVVFSSYAMNFGGSDTNDSQDVFLRDAREAFVTITPGSFAFGTVTVGVASQPQTLSVANTGGQNLTIAPISLTGTDAGSYAIQNDTCSGQSLLPGTNCTVQLLFAPKTTGNTTAAVEINTNAPNNPNGTVPMTGTGVLTGGAHISVSPRWILFNRVVQDSISSGQTVKVSNIGADVLAIGSLAITGTDASQFVIQNDTCTGQEIAAGMYCTVQIVFSPTSVSSKTAELAISSNDPDTSVVSVFLRGNANNGGGNTTLDVTATLTHSTIDELIITDTPGDMPGQVSPQVVVSFRASNVVSSVDVSFGFATLPTNPVFYKLINGTLKKLYPANQCSGITNVALQGNNFSFTIQDNSECDSDQTEGVIYDPVAVASGSSGGGGAGAGRKGCFIATAAYGSYLEPEVMVLRKFRDQVLMTNTAGRLFVTLYYSYSPPVARIIAGNAALRFVVRMLLTPLVYAMNYPVLLTVFLLLPLFFVAMRYSRRRSCHIS